MKEKRTGVIGAGWFGRAHARVYNTISDLQAIVDTNAEQAKAIADTYNINHYLDFTDMLKNEDLDAVSIALPPRMIPLVANDFAKEGIDVLIEKPLGTNIDEIKGLLKYSADVRLTCGFIERFNPVVERLARRLPDIGTPIMVSSKRIGRYPKRFWDIGVLLDLGIHEIDIHRHLFGDALNVTSKLSFFKKERYEDAAFILLEFSNNVNGLIEVNWLTPTKYRKLMVYGSEGVIEVDYSTQELKYIKSSEEPALYRMEESIQPYAFEEPLLRELKAFLYDKTNPIPLEDGIKSLEIALQCLKQD